MGTTANALVYPELTDAPNGPGGIQALAVSVDARYGLTVADWTALVAVATPYAGMRVYVTSLAGAATYNGTKWLAPDQRATKAADESRTSTTALTDDLHLFASIPAVGTYEFDLYAQTSGGNAAGDIKAAFTFPTGTLNFMGMGLVTAIASGSTGSTEFLSRQAATSGSTVIQYGVSATPTWFWLHGTLDASATGTLKLQWGQRLSSGTATKILAGSHLRVRNPA